MRRAVLPVVVAALLLAPGASAWTWPAGGAVLQPFLFDPGHPYAAGQHRGLDIGGADGSAVVAPASGTASFAGTVPSSGKSVTIETPDGYSVTLTHLGSITVARGAAVAEGAPVGTIGPSGDGEVAEPYVHLGVRLTAQEQGYLDPATLLPPRGAAPPAEPAPVPSPAASAPAAPAPAPAAPVAAPSAAPASAPEPVAAAVPAASSPVPADAAQAVVVAAPGGRSATPARGARLMVEPAAGRSPGHAAQPTVTSAATRPAPRVEPARPRANAVPARTLHPVTGKRARRPGGGRTQVSRSAPSRPLTAITGHAAVRLTVDQPRHAVSRAAARAASMQRSGSRFSVASPAGFLLALPLLVGALGLAAGLRKSAPIIAADALLRDDPDLLRERQAAHWPRVHDDRRGHPRAASSPARRGDLLPHRRRRARDEGLAGR